MDVVLEGLRPYDGRYELIRFNRREQGQIRRLSGWMPVQYEEALDGGDAEFVAVLAVLSMCRAGRIELSEVPEVYGKILDGDDVEITLDATMDADVGEGEGQPPPPQSSSLSSDISGPGSSRSSETSQESPPNNGTHDSATSESAPQTLEI